jgi:hypothetical protein
MSKISKDELITDLNNIKNIKNIDDSLTDISHVIQSKKIDLVEAVRLRNLNTESLTKISYRNK